MSRIILDKTIRPARPLRRNIQCIAFMASSALVVAMVAQGIRVRLNVLDTWHYVAPLEDMTPAQLHELLQHGDFKYIAAVTFLVSPLNSLQTFNLPGSWNSANNKIETIGGGGSGGCCTGSQGTISSAASGAGGAGYSKIVNFVGQSGNSVQYQIGAGGTSVQQVGGTTFINGLDGGDTWWNGTALGSASVSSERGHGGAASTGGGSFNGGAGGSSSNGIGSTKQSGSGGGQCPNTSGGFYAASGGGGAGGPNGGGGAVSTPSLNGTSAGGSADGGTVGGGGGGGTSGSNGNSGTEFDGSHGCGSGGGGGLSNSSTGAHGGAGANYGGGGAGAAGDQNGSATSGVGAQGIIVVTNVVATRAIFAGIIG